MLSSRSGDHLSAARIHSVIAVNEPCLSWRCSFLRFLGSSGRGFFDETFSGLEVFGVDSL